MWKIFAAFIAFALVALFAIMNGGDKVEMQGEMGEHAHASPPRFCICQLEVVRHRFPKPHDLFVRLFYLRVVDILDDEFSDVRLRPA